MNGRFIVLDGNDGSGKATQAKLLVDRLNDSGMPAMKVDFPAYDRNVFGARIGECLAGKRGDFLNLDPKIASSLYALDRYESSTAIRTALDEGKTVIADRFTSSNQIHQGGKINDASERAAFLEWISKVEHEVLGIPRPDVVVYLRVPVSTSLGLLMENRAKNGSLSEALDVVEGSRVYLEQSKETAEWLLAREANWRVIDCMHEEKLRLREEIHEDIWAILGAS